MGEAYAATPEAIPPGPQYVALGHIHAPQRVPGAKVPAEYAGSLLEMDFGEAGEQKRVVVVDVEPGIPARVTSIPLSAGRRLMRPQGEWGDVLAMEGVYESYLDLTVQTAGPDPELAERARQEFEYVVKVRADYPRAESERPAREARTLEELYGDYYLQTEGVEVPEALTRMFRSLADEVDHATA